MIRRNAFNKIILQGQLGEKCGVIGLWTEDKMASYYVRKGLSTLQHRGQESAGISISAPRALASSKRRSEENIKTYKGMGLVPNVLTADVLYHLGESKAAIDLRGGLDRRGWLHRNSRNYRSLGVDRQCLTGIDIGSAISDHIAA